MQHRSCFHPNALAAQLFPTIHQALRLELAIDEDLGGIWLVGDAGLKVCVGSVDDPLKGLDNGNHDLVGDFFDGQTLERAVHLLN